MIPRSALVEPIPDGTADPGSAVDDGLMAAAEAYHSECLALLGELAESIDPATVQRTREALDSARAAFLRRVGEKGAARTPTARRQGDSGPAD